MLHCGMKPRPSHCGGLKFSVTVNPRADRLSGDAADPERQSS